ncbi:zinc finger protein ZFP2-like [Wyeomyia smithii]|uniref:zinc finger protein ZFP2-like n=1 Tax=Wyeomyia smithii TaxID=174621 RepID=UPI002467F307|nr:zinc finger protein ZFP2-like [Wyeomyia smithii]
MSADNASAIFLPELVEIKVEPFEQETTCTEDAQLEKSRLKRLQELRKYLQNANFWESLKQKYLNSNAELINTTCPLTESNENMVLAGESRQIKFEESPELINTSCPVTEAKANMVLAVNQSGRTKFEGTSGLINTNCPVTELNENIVLAMDQGPQMKFEESPELINTSCPVTEVKGTKALAVSQSGPTKLEATSELINTNCPVKEANENKVLAEDQSEQTKIEERPIECICEICGLSYITMKGMLKHMELHHEIPGTTTKRGKRTFFKCKFCQLEFIARTQLFQHVNRQHSDEHSQKPPIDGIETSNITKTETDIPSAQSKVCSSCNVESNNIEEFIAHLQSVHPETFCDICYKVFSDSTFVMLHRRVHFAGNPYACDLCPKVFKSLGHVGEHRRGHTGDKPYKCAQCPIGFARMGDLNKHIKSQHIKEPSYECKICLKMFRSSTGYHQHKRKHRTGENVAVTDDRFGIPCDLCDQSFENRNQRKEHVLTCHSEGRPYECSTCGKRFKLSGHLKAHQYTHTGVKEHRCDQCPAAFYLAGDLRRHQKTQRSHQYTWS